MTKQRAAQRKTRLPSLRRWRLTPDALAGNRIGMMRVFNAWPQLIGFLAEMGGVATGNEEKPNVVGLPPSDIV